MFMKKLIIFFKVLIAIESGFGFLKLSMHKSRSPFESDEQIAEQFIDLVRYRQELSNINQTDLDFSRVVTDYYYTGVRFGTPSKMFHLLIDTSVGTVFVPSTLCPANVCLCALRRKYNRAQSYTYEEFKDLGGTNFTHITWDKVIAGTFSKDEIMLGGWQVHQQIFAEISFLDGDFFKNAPTTIDGILGLGLQESAINKYPTIYYNLIYQDYTVLHAPVFTMFFHQNPYEIGGSAIDGTLSFGYIDETKHLDKIERFMVHGLHHWDIEMKEMRISNAIMCKSCIFKIDTSSKFMTAEPGPVERFNSKIEATRIGDIFVFECEKLSEMPDLIFFYGANGEFHIEPHNYTYKIFHLGKNACISGVVEKSEKETWQGWVLGLIFIKNFFVVFDFSQKEVGLAKPAVQHFPSK